MAQEKDTFAQNLQFMLEIFKNRLTSDVAFFELLRNNLREHPENALQAMEISLQHVRDLRQSTQDYEKLFMSVREMAKQNAVNSRLKDVRQQFGEESTEYRAAIAQCEHYMFGK